MENRVNILKTEADATNAMYALSSYIEKSQLSTTHKELIKLRASQLNGCAFCLDMHSKDAIKYGETVQRIVLLDAWKETTLYSEEERIILEMTEVVTLIHQGGISDELYKKARNLFDENYFSQIVMAIVLINSWNRIAISSLLQPGK